MSEQLRKLAEMLRKSAEEVKVANDVKCAQAIQAAMGLQVLRNKLGMK